MVFCSNCGTKLVLSQGEPKFLLICPNCGHKEGGGRKTVVMTSPKRSSIVVLGKEEQRLRTLPKVRAKCPRCEHNSAFWWTVQLRGSDESSTQFFRCTKCGYTWREVS